jgi:hypothetical protein
MRQRFNELTPLLEKESGGIVHLVHQTGSRLAYVAGVTGEHMLAGVAQRVDLADGWALLFYGATADRIDEAKIREMFL